MHSRHLGHAQVFTLLPIGINRLTFHQNNKPTATMEEPILNPHNSTASYHVRMPEERDPEEVCWD